jgi:PKD repeat protein
MIGRLLILLLFAGLLGASCGCAWADDTLTPVSPADGGCDAIGTCPAPAAVAPRAAGGPTITTVSRTETAILFRTDIAPELDQTRGTDAGTPETITFTINASGLREAANASLPVSATLTVRVFDVDAAGDADTPECLVEQDLVRFNGHDVGRLGGTNEMWSINTFRIEPSWIVEGENTVVIVINALHTPCWTTKADWGEVRVELEPLPRLERINVTPAVPVTGQRITFSATFREQPGFEITGVRWYLYSGTSRTEIASSAAEGQKVNPWTFTPSVGQYGNRTIVCRAVCRNTRTGVDGIPCGEKNLSFGVFFPMVRGSSGWVTSTNIPVWAKDFTNPGIGVKKEPNWYRYWKQDRAIDGIEPFQWDGTAGAGYMFPGNGTAALGPQGAAYWTATTINTSFGKEQFGGYVGIETATATVWHERRHYEIGHAWDAGGPFYGLVDSDRSGDFDDSLPDAFENGTVGTTWEPAGSRTNWTNTDTYTLASVYSDEYQYYGDNEYLAYRAENAARSSKKHDDRDWSDTGAMAKAQGATGLGTRAASGGAASAFAPAARDAPETDGFTGNYADAGIDTDGNGLYDLVRATVDIGLNRTARCTVEGTLSDGSGTALAVASAVEELEPGMYAVDLDFDALDLQASGAAGPYRFSAVLYEGGRERWVHGQTGPLATKAYTLAELEGSQVVLTDATVDRGVDYNDDGALDALEVEVGMTAARALNATLTGSLYANETPIATASAPLALRAGPASAALRFDGLAVALAGLDGPFEVREIAIAGPDGRTLASSTEPHATGPYRWTLFRPAGFALQGPFSETREDSDGDGTFNRLVIGLGATVAVPGKYTFAGVLEDSTGAEITRVSSAVELGTGTTTVALPFDGTAIFAHGADGPYRLDGVTVTDATGAVVAYETGAFTTSSIAYTAFQRPGVRLAGPYADTGDDSNHNARFETLVIAFDVALPWEGTYYANARLLAPDGSEVQRASTQFSGFGTQRATLRFDGRRIWATGQNGGFTVADLTVYRADAPAPPFIVQPFYAASAFTTRAYQSSQFEPGAGIEGTVRTADGGAVSNATVFIIGTASSATNADGSYGLAVPSAGTYTVRAEPPSGSGLLNATANVTVATSCVATVDFTLVGTVPSVATLPGGVGVPTDTNGDGIYDDTSGNGRRDFADVVLYFTQMSWIAGNEPVGLFDYNGNGRIDFADVVWLFTHL